MAKCLVCSPGYLLVTLSSLEREKRGSLFSHHSGNYQGKLSCPCSDVLRGQPWGTVLSIRVPLPGDRWTIPSLLPTSVSCFHKHILSCLFQLLILLMSVKKKKKKKDDCCCWMQVLYISGNHCISTGRFLCNLCIMLSFSFFHFPVTNPYRVGI